MEIKLNLGRCLNKAKKQPYTSTTDGVSGPAEIADFCIVHCSMLLNLNQSDNENVLFTDSMVHDSCLPTFFRTYYDDTTLLLQLPFRNLFGLDQICTKHLHYTIQ